MAERESRTAALRQCSGMSPGAVGDVKDHLPVSSDSWVSATGDVFADRSVEPLAFGVIHRDVA